MVNYLEKENVYHGRNGICMKACRDSQGSSRIKLMRQKECVKSKKQFLNLKKDTAALLCVRASAMDIRIHTSRIEAEALFFFLMLLL